MTASTIGKTIASVLGAPATEHSRTEAVRLSESPLWERQRTFYATDATGLWGTSLVPHGITANPAIAHTHARIAWEFVRSSGAPATVVELGGGSGRFAYLFVRALRDLAPGLDFTYVLTDFSAERVAGWAAHPSYAPLVEAGLLDFAVLDADDLGETTLAVSGRRLGPGSLDGPVVGIANYVFDTLRQDAYAVRGGVLLESRVSVLDGESGLDVAWETAPCGPLPDDLAAVLEHYRDTLDDTTVLVPTGGLRCLDFLDSLGDGPSLALVADKGHATELGLCSQEQPAVVPHGSGFSLMLNFDLLARVTRGLGGVAVLPPAPARSLVVAAYVRGAIDDPDGFTALALDQLVDIGPDNYFVVRPRLGGLVPDDDAALATALACLRLTRHDPTMLVELLPTLLEVLPQAPDVMRAEVEVVLLRVWDHWFPIGEPVDLALCVGLAFSAMDRFSRAVDFLELSVKERPDSAPAAFAMGVARRGLRDLQVARQWAERAVELEPSFSQARSLRAVIDDELGVG